VWYKNHGLSHEGEAVEITACMKTNIVSIDETASILEAARRFVEWHVGLLPILDKNRKPIGCVGLGDMLRLELPDFLDFVTDMDFVHDFGAVETTRPSLQELEKPIKTLMKPAITVPEDSGLLRAYALMLQHNLHDILVVLHDGTLAGIASRVDIGVAILSEWNKVGPGR
jgi:CBS domain-containing protein